MYLSESLSKRFDFNILWYLEMLSLLIVSVVNHSQLYLCSATICKACSYDGGGSVS